MKRFFSWLIALTLLGGVAQAAELPLGAGDVVKVTVFGQPDMTTETRVTEKGVITFPLIGEVEVKGLSSAAAEQKIAAKLASGGFVKSPQVTLLVTLLQSQQVSVLGQVNRPGRYPLDNRRNVMDMLALAGGVSQDGGDIITVVQSRNGANVTQRLDVADLLRNGAAASTISVDSGDVIYVERAPRFYIYGEVQRPGVFRLERAMTVLQALSTGGGLTARGTERNVRIKRRDNEGKLQIISVKHDELLLPDDVVYVQESLF
jgi:polysaccharide export outer membrane protein